MDDLPATIGKTTALRETYATSPAALMDLVRNGIGAEELRQLIDLQERMDRNNRERAFNAAMARAKAKLKPIFKETQAYNYTYADLGTTQKKVDPILSDEGLFYRWECEQEGDKLTVTCILTHEDGHKETNALTSPVSPGGTKMTPVQALGATKTYLERYTLMGAIGLASTKDIDGSAKNIPDEPPKTIGLVPNVDIGPPEDFAGGIPHKLTKDPEIEKFSRQPGWIEKERLLNELIEGGAGPVEINAWASEIEPATRHWPPRARGAWQRFVSIRVDQVIDDRAKADPIYDPETGEIER